MISILGSEFYKLIHNRVLIISLFSGFILGIIVNIVYTDGWKSQVDIMSFIFPILLCLLVGCIWSIEYSDRTITYMLLSGKQKEKIFMCKVFSSFVTASVLFFVYVLGLLFSNSSVFLNFKYIGKMYIIPFCLNLAYTEIIILIAVLCKSFSKTVMAAALIMLFNIFIFKLSLLYGDHNICIRFLGEYTYYGIYVLTYQTIGQSILLFRCIINFVMGFVALLLAFIAFIKTNVH